MSWQKNNSQMKVYPILWKWEQGPDLVVFRLFFRVFRVPTAGEQAAHTASESERRLLSWIRLLNEQRNWIPREQCSHLVGNHFVSPIGQPQSMVAFHLGEEQQQILRTDFG